MVERLSIRDNTFFSSFADHILRYRFAEPHCIGKRVLDAGCGIGYGSDHLARNGASEVVGIDISNDALAEAKQLFGTPNLRFTHHNVENLNSDLGSFDVVVNFENIEHLKNPGALVQGASHLAPTFITSTPNGEISSYTPDGKLANEFHVKEFTADELRHLLLPYFKSVELFGQWLTPGGKLRKIRARQLFEDMSETYYNPANRVGRIIKRALGKRTLPPPKFYGEANSFEGDYVILPIESRVFSWQPAVILAVCRNYFAATIQARG